MWRAYKDFWIRGTRFKGTSSRSQYWWVALFDFLIRLIPYYASFALIMWGAIEIGMSYASTGGLHDVDGVMPLTFGMILLVAVVIYNCASLVPKYALMTRRFHDAGFSGWWIWAIILSQVIIHGLVLVLLYRQIMQTGLSNFTAPAFVRILNLLSFSPWVVALVVEVLPTGFHREPFLKH